MWVSVHQSDWPSAREDVRNPANNIPPSGGWHHSRQCGTGPVCRCVRVGWGNGGRNNIGERASPRKRSGRSLSRVAKSGCVARARWLAGRRATAAAVRASATCTPAIANPSAREYLCPRNAPDPRLPPPTPPASSWSCHTSRPPYFRIGEVGGGGTVIFTLRPQIISFGTSNGP